MLTVEGLQVAYGDFQVLWDVSMRADAGEIVCLLGPNGAGKSTLMNTISGLIMPRGGRVTLSVMGIVLNLILQLIARPFAFWSRSKDIVSA